MNKNLSGGEEELRYVGISEKEFLPTNYLYFSGCFG